MNLYFGSRYSDSPKYRGRTSSSISEKFLALSFWRQISVRQHQLFSILRSFQRRFSYILVQFLYIILRLNNNRDIRCLWSTVEEISESFALLEHNRDYGHLFQGIFRFIRWSLSMCVLHLPRSTKLLLQYLY